MQNLFSIFRRFLPPYKKIAVLNVVFNILSAIFTNISFIVLIPVLNILFKDDSEVKILPEFTFNMEYVKNSLGYYFTELKYGIGIENSLWVAGGIFLLMTLCKVGTEFLASVYMVDIRFSVVRDIREQIYSKVLALPTSFFSEERKGDIISRITGDVVVIQNSVMNSLNMLFKTPILIFVSLGALFFISWKLTLFVLILLPISGFIIGKVGHSLKKTARDGRRKMGEIVSSMEETLAGHRVIKAFNAEEKRRNSFNTENDNYRLLMKKLLWKSVLAQPASELLGALTIVVLICYGGRMVLEPTGTLDTSVFIAYIGIFYSMIAPAKSFSDASFSVQKGLAAMERIDKILQAESSIKEVENPTALDHFKDKIVYDNVSFSYDNKVEVLRNVSVEIAKGQTVALVGESGAGKTTFVDLLPRFYDVSGGQITVDGVDIRNAELRSLRELMGNVNQEPILFNDTFFNNIAFGVENATQEQVEQAAKIANAHEFIMATEKGYQTSVGDRGGKLSGGQRQRISIARAVLKNPPIMILDEATSALDTQSEKYVQEALDNLMKNRTSIVIAHRLSTIRNADIILVFKDGKIVERGKHKELLEQGGVYETLHKMQNKE